MLIAQLSSPKTNKLEGYHSLKQKTRNPHNAARPKSPCLQTAVCHSDSVKNRPNSIFPLRLNASVPTFLFLSPFSELFIYRKQGIKYILRRAGKYFSENKNFFCPQVYIFLKWILQGRIQRPDCASVKSIWHPNQNRRLLCNLLPIKENGLNVLRLLPVGFQPVTHSPEMQGFLQILSTNLHP